MSSERITQCGVYELCEIWRLEVDQVIVHLYDNDVHICETWRNRFYGFDFQKN